MSESIGHGFIGKNDYKEKENQPDYKGKVTVETVDYEIAGWIREKKGRKYISLSFSLPYKKEEKEPDPTYQEDDIPF